MKVLVYSLLLFCVVFSQNTLIDGVVAVVGNKTILSSELEASMEELGKNFFGESFSFSQMNKKELSVFKKDVLDLLVGNKLLLLSAEQDSSISISYNQINSFLDENIQSVIDLDFNGSFSAFEESVGFSVVEYKSSKWEEAQEMLLTEEKKRSLLSSVGITQNEVLLAFNYYKKENPFSPETFSFTLYETPVKPEKEDFTIVEAFLKSIQDSVLNKDLDFETAINKHSIKDPVAEALNGWWLRGELSNIFPKTPDLERLLFSLSIGSCSSPIKTKLGYHLFFLKERAGEKIKIKQLFVPLNKKSVDTSPVLQEHFRLIDLCVNDPGLFDSLAVENKSLIKKENYNGVYSSIGFNQELLSSNPFYNKLSSVLSALADENFSNPFVFNNSVFTAYLYKKENKKPLNKDYLYNNWVVFENMALQNKRNVFIDEWINIEKQKQYVKILLKP